MSILETPKAAALLADATVSERDVQGCIARLSQYVQRYLPLFYRKEQRQNATIVLEGLLSGLERKTCQPIAIEHGVQRKPIQFFVGNGKWDDEAVMAELRRHVAQEIGQAQGVIVLDPSSFPKKGSQSCGVKRQWCGRLGKVENCQTGVFMAYASAKGHAPLDRRLYLPEDWAADRKRRDKCHVPEEVTFEEKWKMADAMLQSHGSEVPHAWVVADEEMGRAAQFRKRLRDRKERYVLDVPCDTRVQDQGAKRGRGKGDCKKGNNGRNRPFVRVDQWAAARPASSWKTVWVRAGEKQPLKVRAGEKQPLKVRATARWVRAKLEKRTGPPERLLVMKTMEKEPRKELRSPPKTTYCLSNAGADVPLEELVRAKAERHRIEQMFEEAKGETGLDHYEVRSWIGWHHHMTLALLALWFLALERLRIGKKKPGGDGGAGSGGVFTAAAESSAHAAADRQAGQRRVAVQ